MKLIFIKSDIRRDQVWFLRKNKYGESIITRLSDVPGKRANEDIEKTLK